MKHKKIVRILIAANFAMGLTAFAQDDASRNDATQSDVNPPAAVQPVPALPEVNEPAGADSKTYEKDAFDRETFLKETAKSGMAELNMAQIGTQKAQDPELKTVAQKLVTDHSKLNDQIKELAQSKNVTLETEIDSKHQRKIDHLSSLSGSEFDKAFVTHMVQGHKKSIAKFKQAAANTEDTEISELAKKTLPTLKEHLTAVQKWAPDTTASGAIEEPAGAEKNSDDANKSGQQYQSPLQDDSGTEQNPAQSPDDAGQTAPK